MSNVPFVIERRYSASVNEVWKAITDKEQMKQWYFNIEDFKPVVGFEFTFSAGSEGKKYVHLCKILEVAPLKKLSYSWGYQGYEGSSIVTFELFAEDEQQTTLKLIHEGIDSFPAKPDFAKESFASGWTYITGTSLKEFLEKEPV